MTRLIVVRHGDTFEPDAEPRRIGRRTDLPLVASGIAQAHALGRHLVRGGYEIDRVVTSPLLRTRETADLICAEFTSPIVWTIAPWLAEIDHGPDENLPESAVLRRIGPAALHTWETAGTPPPGWHVDADARLAAWRDLFAHAGNGDTLLVTSNGAARFALLALPDAPCRISMKLRTGALGVLERRTDINDLAGWSVVEWDTRPDG